MNSPLLVDLKEKNLPHSIGRKAENLRILMDYGIKMPTTYVIPWEIFEYYQNSSIKIIEDLRAEIEKKLDPSVEYAIRSSANVEDQNTFSFAGQFETRLNIHGFDEIISAVKFVWDSTNSASINEYLLHTPVSKEMLKMAVIIQEMVTPVYSGVVFSCNPITGMDEIVIEAVEGSGDKLVQSGETPVRWVYKWGNWIVKPDDNTLPESIMNQVVKGTKKISKRYKKPVDLEWVFNGSTIVWLQLREITTYQQLNIYSNRMSKEMMPGQIIPLVWSINIPLIVPVWISLLKEMVGEIELNASDFARQFHFRSYFNMTTLGKIFNLAGFPSEGLEMMMGIVPKEAGRPVFKMNWGMVKTGPKLIRFLYNKWNFSKKYLKELPLLTEKIEKFRLGDISSLKEQDLIEKVDELFSIVQEIVYFNINIPLLLSMYNNLFSLFLKKKGIQPGDIDITYGINGLENFSPTVFLKKLNKQYRTLHPSIQRKIQSSSYLEFLEIQDIENFKQEVVSFIEMFGHLSDNNNNFTSVPWREKPDNIVKLISDFPDDEQNKKYLQTNVLYNKFSLLHVFYKRVQEYYLFRDQTSNLYTYSYGLFRPLFLALAQIFLEKNFLIEPEDIFLLDWQEIKSITNDGFSRDEIKKKIRERKIAMENSKAVELPTIIYGDQPPPIISEFSAKLRGVPTSQGYYTGTVRKVQGIDDFPFVKQGDVLVIPFSEIGWTPLFAKAGGVVSESGGMLSHSSIIAREYQIPAVVSVHNAMKLEDGQLISIDGYKGEILIHEGQQAGRVA